MNAIAKRRGEVVDISERRPIGRPTIYSDTLAETICCRIADGETLTAICAEPGMPARWTVQRWQHDNEVFRGLYARAREGQQWALAEKVLALAEEALPNDPSAAMVELGRRKLQADNVKWFVSKLAPRVLNEKLAAMIAKADRERQGEGESYEPTAQWLERILADDPNARAQISSDPLTEDEWEAKHAGSENRARVAELLVRLNYVKRAST